MPQRVQLWTSGAAQNLLFLRLGPVVRVPGKAADVTALRSGHAGDGVSRHRCAVERTGTHMPMVPGGYQCGIGDEREDRLVTGGGLRLVLREMQGRWWQGSTDVADGVRGKVTAMRRLDVAGAWYVSGHGRLSHCYPRGAPGSGQCRLSAAKGAVDQGSCVTRPGPSQR